MNRGEIWTAHVGGKSRPVLVVTRDEVIDVRQLVTVAEITTQARGLSTEVAFDFRLAGLRGECVVNCDGLHTVTKSTLKKRVGAIDELTMRRICKSVALAIGC
jgi:mRNA interferase MazF